MYMALTEEQAREIRKLGITVIEWKWCVKENVNVFIYINGLQGVIVNAYTRIPIPHNRRG